MRTFTGTCNRIVGALLSGVFLLVAVFGPAILIPVLVG
jgi:hypothetical protein